MNFKNEKDLSVETLWGLAIALMVIVHVIGSASDGGMQVSDDSFMMYFYYSFIECLQIPLFTIIAVILLIRDLVIPVEYPNYLSYKGAIYLIPFFVLGIGLVRFRFLFQKKIFIFIITAVLVITYTIQQLAWFNIIDFPVTENNLTGLLIGITGTVFLFNLNWQSKSLVWLGAYSYSIFLFHAFGTAGGRIILKFAGINSVVLTFTLSLTCGLLLPVLAHKMLNKSNLTRFVFLGLPILKQDKPKIN
jgi:peptidoglycan/LPS O-acetylase OafA/YrhL